MAQPTGAESVQAHLQRGQGRGLRYAAVGILNVDVAVLGVVRDLLPAAVEVATIQQVGGKLPAYFPGQNTGRFAAESNEVSA